MFRRPFSFLLATFLALPIACSGDEPAPPATSSGITSQDLSVHMLTLSNLQGFAEGIPCTDVDIPPLAGTADLAEELRARGDRVLLTCVGDTTVHPQSITPHLASRLGALARGEVILEALAGAGVEILVPSANEFQAGAANFLRAAKDAGLKILLSNVAVTGFDEEIDDLIVVEHEGFRVAYLGLIPRIEEGSTLVLRDADTVQIAAPVAAAKRAVARVREEGLAHVVIAYSALSQEQNRQLGEIPGLNFVIGTSSSGITANVVEYASHASLFGLRSSGREVGLTTLRVAGGQLASFSDISSRDRLRRRTKRTLENLRDFAQAYGTDDPVQLAPLVNPRRPDSFLEFISTHEENMAWLAETETIQESFVEHHAAALSPVEQDHVVTQILDRQGAAIESRLAALGTNLEKLHPLKHPPVASDCISCHSEQVAFWEGTAHARSVDTLRALERAKDGSCLICHTTGYGKRAVDFQDVRLESPLDPVGCYSCHEISQVHVHSVRQRTNPLHFIGDLEGIKPRCDACHTRNRNPAFDLDAGIEQVRCPPMRPDDPALLAARTATLAQLSETREAGLAKATDLYLEGRTLLGLERREEAVDRFTEFALGSTDELNLFVRDAASQLELRGFSSDAIAVLRAAMLRSPGEGSLNMMMVQLLLHGQEEAAHDSKRAVALLELLMPPDLSVSPRIIELRKLQIEAYFINGDVEKGGALLDAAYDRFPSDSDVIELYERYGP